MKTKIYTKGGDQGQTSLFGGPRVSKSHLALEAYGTVDELNAALGVALAPMELVELNVNLQQLQLSLKQIQNELFIIGSHLACADEEWRDKLPATENLKVNNLEAAIDAMTARLPELREFVLPGGHPLAAQLHVCRTICRRAERSVVLFFENLHEPSGAPQSPYRNNILVYLNRLSDFLFVAARFANFENQNKEITWKKP